MLICGIKKLKLAWYIASWKIAIGCYLLLFAGLLGINQNGARKGAKLTVLLIKKYNLWLKRKFNLWLKLQAPSNA